jgi:hypothetical protein
VTGNPTPRDLNAAKTALRRQGTGFVVVKSGQIVASAAEHGIGRLIAAADHLRAAGISGAALADAVVGRAALMVAVWADIHDIHAEIISDGALEDAATWDRLATYERRVPAILNRARDGTCPFEAAATAAASEGAPPGEIVNRLRAVARGFAQQRAQAGERGQP